MKVSTRHVHSRKRLYLIVAYELSHTVVNSLAPCNGKALGNLFIKVLELFLDFESKADADFDRYEIFFVKYLSSLQSMF